MNEFLDTSVLVAAFWGGHPQHEPSLQLLSRANPGHACCGIHASAELFATMTALPVKPQILPEQAFLFVEEVRRRLKLVSLDEGEYLETLEQAAGQGLRGGRIYDALLIRCARKVDATAIYTWNLKHYRSIAPDLAVRMRTP